MGFDREQIRKTAAELAVKGVFIGTSSWKYTGWCDMLYDWARYEYRGKFAESRFEKNCLAEYAEVFICGSVQDGLRGCSLLCWSQEKLSPVPGFQFQTAPGGSASRRGRHQP
jgi:hypothetical protein